MIYFDQTEPVEVDGDFKQPLFVTHHGQGTALKNLGFSVRWWWFDADGNGPNVGKGVSVPSDSAWDLAQAIIRALIKAEIPPGYIANEIVDEIVLMEEQRNASL